MPFKKGNKLAKGGKRPGAGPPTKEQRLLKLERNAEAETLQQAVERIRDEYSKQLSEVYYNMALNDPATMRHVIDRVMPPAKQQIEVEGVLTVVHKTNLPE